MPTADCKVVLNVAVTVAMAKKLLITARHCAVSNTHPESV
jgi:hypothetical protein